MATAKKTTPAKAPARRRSPAQKVAARRRRPTSAKVAGMGVNVKDLGMAIVGAMLANAYADKIPLKDPKFRYGALTVGAGLAAYKGPKELRPLFIGAAVVGGVKTAAVVFPKLLPAPGATTTTTTDEEGKMIKTGGNLTTKTIGRRDPAEMRQIREAVEHGIRQREINGPIMGPIMGRRRRRSGSIFAG